MAADLREGDPVLYNGYKIGQVTHVWPDGQYAIRLDGVSGEYTRGMLEAIREAHIGGASIDYADD